MLAIELQQYIDQQGHNQFERWYEKLDFNTRARVVIKLNRLRQGSSVAKSVGSGVSELRMDFGPGYRVYFGRDGETLVILLGGGTKKHQGADIEAAQQLWREYKLSKRRNDAPNEEL